MSNYLGLIQLALFASVGFAFLAALISRVVYPLIRKRLLQQAPARRSNILLIWLLVPASVGLLFTLLSLMPSFLSLMGIDQDHCSVHDGHVHLCLIHPPLPLDNITSWGLITLLGVMAVIFAGKAILGIVRGYKLYKGLMMASLKHGEQDFRIVEWNGPLALSAGLSHMSVFISRQLMQSLTTKQLDVVLAHERSHAERKDTLRQLIAHALSFAHIPWMRRSLLADMNLASEQACDEAAARITGDRLHVADTIVSIERMFIQKPLPFSALSISGSDITARVESLLHKPHADSPSWRGHLILTGILVLIAAFTSAGELHHHTESILGFLTR
jgi:beta-lactamase regulating signal transducer with metallopeptidase domain